MASIPPSTEAATSFDAIIADPKVRRLFVVAAAVAGKGLKAAGRKAAVELISRFSAYEDYLVTTYRRVSTIKTFAAPTTPVPLLDHFVDTYLTSSSDTIIDQVDLLNRVSDGARIVISALAGFGKSVLMRYLAISLYETPNGKIPIFIELRDLNRIQSPDIISYIHSNYKQNSDIDKAVLDKGLRSGIFALFLDGFDEINFDKRPVIEDNILEISENYPKISIFVSGRPDPTFESWQEFSTFGIAPMNLDQVRSLIEKIDYDQGLKDRFLAKLDDGLYERHSSFLSTPLLATLMMMTYENNAAIPDKMHLFYQRAFETLFDKHDTYKEQYERKRRSNLRIDEFSRLFSTFCIYSYLEENFEFSYVGIIESINQSIEYCGYDVSPSDVLFDLTESVCLIQLEGFFYSFVHRSFQEYFSALFLCQCPDDLRDDFLDDFVFRPWDSVLSMLFDMSKDRLEAAWVAPRVKEYLIDVEQDGPEHVAMRALLARWAKLELKKNRNNEAAFYRLVPGKFNGMLNILSRFYNTKIPSESTFLTVDLVDELGQLCCSTDGAVKYLLYRNYIDRRDEFVGGDNIIFDLSLIENSTSAEMILTQEFNAYTAIRDVSYSIAEEANIRQNFIKKLKGSSK